MKRDTNRRYYEVRKPIDALDTYNLDKDLYDYVREQGWTISNRRNDYITNVACVTLGPLTEVEAVALRLKFSDLFETWEMVEQ